MGAQGIVIAYLAAVNLLAFSLFGIDKRRARLGRWRVREATLLLAASVGGSVGALLGMRLFRHKTRKRRFTIGVPLILAAQVIAAVLLFRAFAR